MNQSSSQSASIPRLRPVIRVFVSSTFSDLKNERNALQEIVFPKLETLCEQNGFLFQSIDLRWGVTRENGLDHRTMRICFDELRRAQQISPEPNFLILLGDRYGWRPLPEEISIEEFGMLESKVFGHARSMLQKWYVRDENADPPTYLLQSREQKVGDGKDYTDDQAWKEAERVLRDIVDRGYPIENEFVQRFAHPSSLAQPLPSIVRFQASATEQEIWRGALGTPNAQEHVLAFLRQIDNTEEFLQSFDIKAFVDVDQSGKIDEFARAALQELKRELGSRLNERHIIRVRHAQLISVANENGERSTDVTTEHLNELCTRVHDGLKEIISRQIKEYWVADHGSAERAARELEHERKEHVRFALEQAPANAFVGRETHLKAIGSYINSTSRHPLVIHGGSGCGKTALLARAAQIVAPTFHRVARFIGVTPRSSDVRSLLVSLCQELRSIHPLESSLSTDLGMLVEELNKHFKSATPQAPLILFLDALDQLAEADNGLTLSWLTSGQLPEGVKLIVSCLSDRSPAEPGGQPYAALRRRPIPEQNFINLDALSKHETEELLFERWLPQARRKLSSEQTEHVKRPLRLDACRRPLYLKLLFEEMRQWRSYDVIPDLGENMDGLLGHFFGRLETNHGPLFVERVMTHLVVSRRGLAENEILEILFADPTYRAALDKTSEQTRHELPQNAKRIPNAIWSRLRFDLTPYLSERAAVGCNVLTFYHRQVADTAGRRFVKSYDQSCESHRQLASYFTQRAKGAVPEAEWETSSIRGFAECIFHTIKAGRRKAAEDLLTNFAFTSHKLRVGLLEGLLEDYSLLLEGCTFLPHRSAAEPVLEIEMWDTFFLESAHILRRGSDTRMSHKILLQLATEHADECPVTKAAEEWLKNRSPDWLWMRSLQRPAFAPTGCVGVLEGHAGAVLGAAQLPEGELVSWSADGSFRLWNSDTLACLESGNWLPTCERLLSDGRSLAWTEDEIRYFSYRNERITSQICPFPPKKLWKPYQGHRIRCLADGRRIDSTERGEVVLLSPEGRILQILRGHSRQVYEFIELPGSRLLTCSEDSTLRMWDLENGECLQSFHYTGLQVSGATMLSGNRLLTWGAGEWDMALGLMSDNSLELWDTSSGEHMASLAGHSRQILGAFETSDERLVTWSADKTLRVWRLQGFSGTDGQCRHDHAVKGALKLSNERSLSWSESDIKLWDFSNGACLATGSALQTSNAMELRNGHIITSSFCRCELWHGGTLEHLASFEFYGTIEEAWSFEDGTLLILSSKGIYTLWDPNNSLVRELPASDALIGKLPNLGTQRRAFQPVLPGIRVNTSNCTVVVQLDESLLSRVYWNADSELVVQFLEPDGRLLVTQDNGHVSTLRLCHGSRFVSFEEACLIARTAPCSCLNAL